MLYPRHGVQRFGYSLWSLQMQHVQHELFNQHLSNKGDETCVSMRHVNVQEHMGCRMPQRLGHEANGFVRKPAAVRSLLTFIDSFHTSWPPSWPHLQWRLEVFACFFVRSCLGWHFVAFISSSDCIQVWVLAVHRFQLRCTRARKPTLTLTQLSSTTARQTTQASQSSWRMLASRMYIAAELQANSVKILDFLCARQVVTYLKP